MWGPAATHMWRSPDHSCTPHACSLQDTQLTDACAKHLVGLLEHNPTLTVLDVSENRIGDAGAEALARGLRMNVKLHTL